jgi:peptidyl-prolyl cis-trans isomerase C
MNLLPPRRPAPPPAPITVNGTVIPRSAVTREAQYHPAPSAAESRRLAAEALVLRELLLQEARRQAIEPEPRTDERGRRETAEEAMIRALAETAIVVPKPTVAEVARYHEANRNRFRSPDLYEARHILIAARRGEADAYAAAREHARAIAAEVAARPDRFADLARSWSACASAGEGGWLGQITAAEVTPAFAAALRRLAEGETTAEPVEAPYGFHIIRLERRFPGRVLPLAAVADRIAAYLVERSYRLASAQFLARLVSAAEITGLEMANAAALRVD